MYLSHASCPNAPGMHATQTPWESPDRQWATRSTLCTLPHQAHAVVIQASSSKRVGVSWVWTAFWKPAARSSSAWMAARAFSALVWPW